MGGDAAVANHAAEPMTDGATRRILVVSPWLPEPPFWGSAIRVRELVRGLARNHSVTLIAYARPWEEDNLPAVRLLCDSVHLVRADWPEGSDRMGRFKSLLSLEPHAFRRFAGPAMQEAIDRHLEVGGYDVVQVETSHLSGLDLSRAPVTVLDEHNVEYELLARGLRVERDLARKAFGLAEYFKVRHAERRAWQRFDACVMTSERELHEVRRYAGGRPVAAVANGVDLDHFSPQPAARRSGLVFTGLMRYRPNIDAVTYFVKEVLPLVHRSRPDVTLTIVGWGLNDEVRALLGPRVVATDRVPDVRPYLAGAAAVVAPIRMGSGTRLKILEALAMAKPVISTSQACEGLDLEHGRELLIADDPGGFASAVLRILDDQAFGDRLGEAGRARVEAGYGWNASVARLEELHDRATEAKASANHVGSTRDTQTAPRRHPQGAGRPA